MVLIAGCATTTPPADSVRFVDRPILWRDPDGQPSGVPAQHQAGIQWTGMRDAAILPAERALSLDYGVESVNVNALDEVPDSNWYVDRRRAGLEGEDRVRPRTFSADEMTRGDFGDDPGPQLPITIIKGKAIGSTPGLVGIDARGKRYMLKLDPPGWLGMNTSTEVVATRLAWAAGWLVPAEMIIDVRPEDLRLDPKAKTKDEWDHDIPLTAEMLAKLMARTPREADGRVRICASRWLAGRALGSWAYYGKRSDDANDRIAHENRRDVRGFGVFAAWVNDIDTMENNTMDAYIGKDGSGYVVHYQQDVGGSFGQFAAIPLEVWMGDETYFMPGRIFESFLTLGFMQRHWEGSALAARREQQMRDYHELGYFDDETFDARSWHPILDNPAFVRQTARDRYWGAKVVAAFTQEEVRAAVALGHYQPATEQRLFQILWTRRERILRAFFSDVAPLDYFRFAGHTLCYDDLWLQSALGQPEATRYFVVENGARRTIAGGCIATDAQPGYHIVQLGAQRDGVKIEHVPTVKVHFVATADGAHVIGIER